MKNFNIFIKCFSITFIFLFSAASAAYIFTDKNEYNFEENVEIYGREFPTNLDLIIIIYNPNTVEVRDIDVSSDNEGNFTAIYFIPVQSSYRGIIEGTYTIAAPFNGGNPITTFNVTSTTVDTTPPTFSGNQTNETQPGKPCEFKLTWNDNKALQPSGQYIFSTDNSGSWMNASSVNFVSTPQIVTYITNLRSTEGLVKWKYYASDNASNWASSDTYEVNVVTTTTTVPCDLQTVKVGPKCSGDSSSDCAPGEKIQVNATYSGNCPDPAYIQVNANGTGCYICDQDRDTCASNLCNMTGIAVSCSGSPCSEDWTVPTVPAECQGETVNATYSSLNSNYPCRTGNQKKDEVTPTGSFTFYLTTTTPTTTSPGGNGGDGDGTSTSTTTTTVVTTTTPVTTSPQTTTTPGGTTITTLPDGKKGGSIIYWAIAIVIIIAVAGVFIWFKYIRGAEESAFERLKQKWRR
jgi:hypothetical protein